MIIMEKRKNFTLNRCYKEIPSCECPVSAFPGMEQNSEQAVLGGNSYPFFMEGQTIVL